MAPFSLESNPADFKKCLFFQEGFAEKARGSLQKSRVSLAQAGRAGGEGRIQCPS